MTRQLLPSALLSTIDEIGRLPGVGARTAERYAYFLLRADDKLVNGLATSISELHAGVKTCPVTFALISEDEEVSALYADSDRNKQLVAVVEEPLDIVSLERTGQFSGTYH
ncbi:MAG: recombination protein RecR, partial [Candidatus Saccharibacteria bacterium]